MKRRRVGRLLCIAALALATDIAAVIAADPGAGIAASGAEPSPARLAEALAGLIPGALRLAGEAGAARLGIRPGVTPAIVLRP